MSILLCVFKFLVTTFGLPDGWAYLFDFLWYSSLFGQALMTMSPLSGDLLSSSSCCMLNFMEAAWPEFIGPVARLRIAPIFWSFLSWKSRISRIDSDGGAWMICQVSRLLSSHAWFSITFGLFYHDEIQGPAMLKKRPLNHLLILCQCPPP